MTQKVGGTELTKQATSIAVESRRAAFSTVFDLVA